MDEGLEEGRAEGGGVEFVQEIGVGGGHGDGACCLTIICPLCFCSVSIAGFLGFGSGSLGPIDIVLSFTLELITIYYNRPR